MRPGGGPPFAHGGGDRLQGVSAGTTHGDGRQKIIDLKAANEGRADRCTAARER